MDNHFFITELDKYIASVKNRYKTILTALNWTEEDTLKESTCVLSKEKNEPFDKNDPQLPESFDCDNSVVIDENQMKIILNTNKVVIPQKFSDIQLNFTRTQKSDIYNYVIANTVKTSEPEVKVSFPNDDNDAMTFAEIVAKEKKKDKKLQRKYRTSKPTHIEEVRNLVNLQMQALGKYFNPKPETPHTSYKGQDSKLHFERTRHRNQAHFSHDRRKSRSRSRCKADVSRKDVSNQKSRITNRHNRFSDRKTDSFEKRNKSKSKSPTRVGTSGRNRDLSNQSTDRKTYFSDRQSSSFTKIEKIKSEERSSSCFIKKEILEDKTQTEPTESLITTVKLESNTLKKSKKDKNKSHEKSPKSSTKHKKKHKHHRK